MAILRRPGEKDRVIEPRWYRGLALKSLRVIVALALSPLLIPIIVFVLIFRRGK